MKLAFVYCRKCSTVHAPGDHKPLAGPPPIPASSIGRTSDFGSEKPRSIRGAGAKEPVTKITPPEKISTAPHNKIDLTPAEMAEKIAHHRERRRKQAQRYRANKKLKEST